MTNPSPKLLDKNKGKIEPEVEPEVEQTYITYRQPLIENGVQTFKIHGPIPSEKWAEYEKENGL